MIFRNGLLVKRSGARVIFRNAHPVASTRGPCDFSRRPPRCPNGGPFHFSQRPPRCPTGATARLGPATPVDDVVSGTQTGSDSRHPRRVGKGQRGLQIGAWRGAGRGAVGRAHLNRLVVLCVLFRGKRGAGGAGGSGGGGGPRSEAVRGIPPSREHEQHFTVASTRCCCC